MAAKRRVIEAYYNVDGGFWSNDNGDFAGISGMPRITLYEQVVLKLHLIHNYGVTVTDYTADQSFKFMVDSDAGTRLIVVGNSSINSVDALTFWPTADVTKGQFVMLIDANTVALKNALVGFQCKYFSCDFSAFDLVGLIGSYKERIICPNSNLEASEVNEGVFLAGMIQDDIDIPVNQDFVIILANNEQYNLLAPTIEAPESETVNFGVTTITLVTEGFKVFFNATVSIEGYSLRYTLIRKG